jgi:cold shock CspA family protein
MTDTQRLTGMVKWFNNKAGFGFITVCKGFENAEKDIFAHYTTIRVTNSQYKYLVQGEYVDFVLTRSENDKHEFHATDITGVRDGPILCETRQIAHDSQPQRTTYKYRNNGQSDRNRNNNRPASPDVAPPQLEENA